MFDERLVIVGTGIRITGQLTMEALVWMQRADKLYYAVNDPVAKAVIHRLNPEGAESLNGLYGEGKPRRETYEQMIDTILSSVRMGRVTVAAFYGHPGVFAYPSHESVRRARQEGYNARMLPAVSAEDCLFADLNLDPAQQGCQSYEATDFMLGERVIDNSAQLILWQVGIVGDSTYRRNGYDLSALPLLLERLYQYYPPTHHVVVYEASTVLGCEPVVKTVPLHTLPQAGLSAAATLYVPPARPATADPLFLTRLQQLQS